MAWLCELGPQDERDESVVERASGTGDLSFDAVPAMSPSDEENGAWVAAWVWVDDPYRGEDDNVQVI